MLKLIEGSYASFFPKEIDSMFRNRAEAFSDRLGWEVVVKDGYERDRFDDANPLYLVSVDPDTEEYWGSLRLLPTTGPNMLRDVFAQLLDGDFIESATIWESSRICATTLRGRPDRGRSGVNYALSELILGIGEVAVAAGLTQIVSVFDARIFRVLRAAECNPQIIGTPQRIGGTMSYAGLFDAGERPLKAFRAAVGIENSVLAPGRERACVRLGEAGSERGAILSGAHFSAAGAMFCCLQVCSLSFRPYVIKLCFERVIKYGRADWPRNRKSAPWSLKNQRHTLEN
jgi:acyl homoserine lactone synthase